MKKGEMKSRQHDIPFNVFHSIALSVGLFILLFFAAAAIFHV